MEEHALEHGPALLVARVADREHHEPLATHLERRRPDSQIERRELARLAAYDATLVGRDDARGGVTDHHLRAAAVAAEARRTAAVGQIVRVFAGQSLADPAAEQAGRGPARETLHPALRGDDLPLAVQDHGGVGEGLEHLADAGLGSDPPVLGLEGLGAGALGRREEGRAESVSLGHRRRPPAR